MIMTSQQSNALKAELLPKLISTRRTALGRGLGALLMRGRLAASAKELPKLKLPAWAESFEPEHKAWLKKVYQRAG